MNGTMRRLEMKFTIALILPMLILAACSSSPNDQGPRSTAKAHEEAWLTKHDEDVRARGTGDFCQGCHAENLLGNPPVPGCNECHYSVTTFFVHPESNEPALPWSHPLNHGLWAKRDIKKCQGCHSGRGHLPGSNPRFIRQLGKLEMGCESANGCHDNNDPVNSFMNGHNPRAAHPSFDPDSPDKQDRRHWYGENITYRSVPGDPLKNYPLNHSTAGNVANACTLCHGATLQGGVGPGCMECHVLDPIANPERCVSCHGPLPGQQQETPLKPHQLAALAGRSDLLARRTFRNFTSQLTARMRRDPSRSSIISIFGTPSGTFYFKPSAYVSYTSTTKLSARASHLHHDTLPCSYRQDNATCSGCHTPNATSESNIIRHHSLMFSRGLGCTNCHQLSFGSGGLSLGNFRNCKDCHRENFCN